MTISDVVQSGLFEGGSDDQQLIRIPIRADEENKTKRRRRVQSRLSARSRQLWTTAEHDRFLEALELYPSGPWKVIADHIGTRTARQAMTHAQKYREKIERRKQKQRSRNVDGILFKAASKITAASDTKPKSMKHRNPKRKPTAGTTETTEEETTEVTTETVETVETTDVKPEEMTGVTTETTDEVPSTSEVTAKTTETETTGRDCIDVGQEAQV
ncbi:myb domain-contaning protein [Phytophthora cinnamomi]|uniref:myb domain-contaning protein n=1 Tax=Phytophthora cinnamomi TaxID=4785 RepID=UPI003559A283|nr:myb domain-contaning protein [Phytophthora cinnamomi]